jgi:adenylate cyclase
MSQAEKKQDHLPAEPARRASLESRLRDLQIMHENTVEHGTLVENELEARNERINRLLALLRAYLPAQVYDSIARGELAPRLSHRRVKLTIFFSDIVGFTEVTDTLEAETLSSLLNEYLAEMCSIAAVYGATVDKFIGDAIVIFFGDPQFVDDETHARRCVRMAVEMLEKVKVLSPRWAAAGVADGLAVRIGINTGYCTVGNFGSEERMGYTIIGGQVNIAARLESVADRDSIFISESTYALVKDIVDVEGPRVIEVKGIHFPVKVYKIVGVRGGAQAQAPHFEEFGNGFLLRQIYYEPDTAGPQQRERILEDLRRAIRFVDEGSARATGD